MQEIIQIGTHWQDILYDITQQVKNPEIQRVYYCKRSLFFVFFIITLLIAIKGISLEQINKNQ